MKCQLIKQHALLLQPTDRPPKKERIAWNQVNCCSWIAADPSHNDAVESWTTSTTRFFNSSIAMETHPVEEVPGWKHGWPMCISHIPFLLVDFIGRVSVIDWIVLFLYSRCFIDRQRRDAYCLLHVLPAERNSCRNSSQRWSNCSLAAHYISLHYLRAFCCNVKGRCLFFEIKGHTELVIYHRNQPDPLKYCRKTRH